MHWDYLILTASHEAQARAYEWHLRYRRERGLLSNVGRTLVIADTDGKRIGSGGSTLCCLDEVRRREDLGRLRVLIMHAGGDSRRLPAYSPCGKIFIPVPQERQDVPAALFDLLADSFLQLAAPPPGRGQIVVTAGDALLRFDPASARLDRQGATVLSCYATPEEASRHGVYCLGENGLVRRFLQKPSFEAQRAEGAMSAQGLTPLDVGVMSMDADAASRLLAAFEGRREWMLTHGIDLYREICCAMGSEATLNHYRRSARSSGSAWTDEMFDAVFPALRAIPLSAEMIPSCEFLHFGSTRQLWESGCALTGRRETIVLNSAVEDRGLIEGPPTSYIEGCRIAAPLILGGNNVVVGVDVTEPLSLPENACLETIAGDGRWFVRCYGVRDSFKDARFLGAPLLAWMSQEASLWTARIFPAVRGPQEFRQWLWMFAPAQAAAEDRQRYFAAERFSAAEIAVLADQEAFHQRRVQVWDQRRTSHVDVP